MYKYGIKSLAKLNTCHPKLIIIANDLIKLMDVTVLCGNRDQVSQNKAYNEGRSKLKYPQSNHNKSPSLAMDLAPYPIDWTNKTRQFDRMCGMIEAIAAYHRINIRMGRDFSFAKDYPHVELINEGEY